jgi:ubiquinone/menaquinone biosynthesis C-methylase UbiE
VLVSGPMGSTLERYTHGHHESVVGQHRKRTAAEAAAFLLPHLRGGMRLLDIGCGPGSITLGLADAVAPGEVVAIDLSAEVLEGARSLAAEKAVTNVRFEIGNVDRLEYAAGSFDVVYAHQVLQHLPRPVAALGEMKRILKTGGIVGVRDSDYGTCTWSPPDARIEDWCRVYHAVARANGAEADAGRYLHGWLLEAGFAEPRMSGTTWTFPGYDSVDAWASSWADRTTDSNLATGALEYGIASRAELATIAAGFREWCRDPAAFFTIGHVEALGRKP